jgi:hypothetical protein
VNEEERRKEDEMNAVNNNSVVGVAESPTGVNMDLNTKQKNLMNVGESSKTYIIMVQHGEQESAEGGQ